MTPAHDQHVPARQVLRRDARSSRTSPCSSTPRRATASSARTARARPRCCESSPATSPRRTGTVAIPARGRVGVLRQDRFLDDEQIILDLAMMGDAPVWRALRREQRASSITARATRRAWPISRTRSGTSTATRSRRAPPRCSRGSASPSPRTSVPSRRSRAASSCASSSRRCSSAGPTRCSSTSRPTTSTSSPSAGSRSSSPATAASRSSSPTTSASSTTSPPTSSTSTTRPSPQYTGNYTAFVAEKAAARGRKEAEIARAEKIIAEKRAFVERFGAKATKAKQAQSRLKQIERIEVEELEDDARAASPLFRFEPRARERARRPRGERGLEGVRRASRCCATCRSTVRRGEKVADHRAERPRQVDAPQDRHGPRRGRRAARCASGTRSASATSRRITTRCCETRR